jgi:hypothetical protein
MSMSDGREMSERDPEKWQEFEEAVRKIFDAHEFKTSFRVVFKDNEGRSEIDVVAERFNLLICIDAKFYSARRYRRSHLKNEAEKHFKRCQRYSKIAGKRALPVIVSLIDDQIYIHSNCLIVPFDKLNDFLANIHYYLAEFGVIQS